MVTANIDRKGARIFVEGDLNALNLHIFLAVLHRATEKAGYQDLTLDLSKCSAAFPGAMLAVCAQVTQLRESGVYCSLQLPSDNRLRSLFLNANWAHLLDPRGHDPSRFKGYTRIPATQFKGPDQQQTAVNRIVGAILGAIPGMDRADFAAFEWAINELTDNVLTHSESQIGGLVQVSTFQKNKKRVEFVVADAGIGVPESLRKSYPDFSSDTEALDKAIREGVTRDKSLGQGNGLFGSWQICSHSGGRFHVESGHARLVDTPMGGLHVYNERIPYSGTVIVATIDFSNPKLLQEALRLGGVTHLPVDYIETHFEADLTEDLIFRVTDESVSLGSRPAGMPVRQKLLNLSAMAAGRKIYVDFDDIALVSSSFADEVLGKLFAEFGPLEFMQRFELRNMSPMVKQIVDRAMQQRLKV
ncbi:MAG: STAS-like domain-containing protein [Kiloniellales bacterium]